MPNTAFSTYQHSINTIPPTRRKESLFRPTLKKKKRKGEVEIPVERRGRLRESPRRVLNVRRREVPLGGSRHTPRVSTFRRPSIRSKTMRRGLPSERGSREGTEAPHSAAGFGKGDPLAEGKRREMAEGGRPEGGGRGARAEATPEEGRLWEPGGGPTGRESGAETQRLLGPGASSVARDLSRPGAHSPGPLPGAGQ